MEGECEGMIRYMGRLVSGPVAELPSEERARLRRLAVARFVTELGTRSAFVAVVLRADDLTESATAVSLALALTVAADAAVTPVAGIVGDRFDRKKVMILSDIAAAVAYLALAGAQGFTAFVILAVCAVVVESFYFPAAGAAMPNLFGREHLGIANASISQARIAGTILGPVVAGGIAMIDVRWMFVVNAVSFTLSAFLIGGLAGRFRADATSGDNARSKDTADATASLRRSSNFFSLLTHHPLVPGYMTLWAVVQVGAGLLWVGIPALAVEFGSRTIGYSGLLTVGAVGSLLGATLASRFFLRFSLRSMLMVALACQAICLLAVSAAPGIVVAAILLAGFRVAESVTGATALTSFQSSTPDAVRARASAWVDGATIAAFGIGVAAGGPVVDLVGPRWCFAIAAMGAGAGFLVASRLTRSWQVSGPSVTGGGQPAR